MSVEIREAGPYRPSALASVLGRAFVDEPMVRWPLGVHEDVGKRFTRCFEYFLEDSGDLAVVLEAGDAAGVAIWIPAEHGKGPRRGADRSEDARADRGRGDAIRHLLELDRVAAS